MCVAVPTRQERCHRRFVERFPRDVLKRLVIRRLLEQLYARHTSNQDVENHATWGGPYCSRHRARLHEMSILVSWWGSFEDGGETIGDLWAACAVAKRLAASNCNFAIAGRTKYAELPLTVSAWQNAVPEEVGTLIFVCGPVSAESVEFRAMIGHFSRSKKIAAGVSILPQSSSFYWNPFDIVLARDGCAPSYGDLAPAYTTELGMSFIPILRPGSHTISSHRDSHPIRRRQSFPHPPAPTAHTPLSRRRRPRR